MFTALSRVLRSLDDERSLFLVSVSIIVLGICVFTALSYVVSRGETQRFDEQAMKLLRGAVNPDLSLKVSTPKELAEDITALGGHAVLILVIAITGGFLHLDGKRGAARLLIAAGISGYALGLALKWFYARPRPTLLSHLHYVRQSSFPSGHAMMSAIVYLTIAAVFSRLAVDKPRLRTYFILVGLFLTGIVGISRVYLGVHYPTDVLGGWVAGLVWATVCALVARRLQRRKMIESSI